MTTPSAFRTTADVTDATAGLLYARDQGRDAAHGAALLI
ncbi:hypothetical protein AFCDBAGC_5103 [Methylobacterium cerastii]|uniref:Uncharacterized protein n=1 Tax=Methylobacterium cerastii TaxID=932741 RepID=A0ABQ4QPN0_9HYPH|nr:hypothetical protein AFCDBAGC_5103 [Methylobacterium cerastii]